MKYLGDFFDAIDNQLDVYERKVGIRHAKDLSEIEVLIQDAPGTYSIMDLEIDENGNLVIDIFKDSEDRGE